MFQDPIERQALARMIELSADVELQIKQQKTAGFRPVLALLNRARERSAMALAALADAAPEDLRKLQNEIRIFQDLVNDLKWLLVAGREAAAELDQEAINELAAFIDNDEEPAEQQIARTLDIQEPQ